MIVTVLLFGHYRDALAEPERSHGISLEMPEGSSPADVVSQLSARSPAFVDLLVRTRIAVAAEFADPETVLFDGVEVAFLPPMSGG